MWIDNIANTVEDVDSNNINFIEKELLPFIENEDLKADIEKILKSEKTDTEKYAKEALYLRERVVKVIWINDTIKLFNNPSFKTLDSLKMVIDIILKEKNDSQEESKKEAEEKSEKMNLKIKISTIIDSAITEMVGNEWTNFSNAALNSLEDFFEKNIIEAKTIKDKVNTALKLDSILKWLDIKDDDWISDALLLLSGMKNIFTDLNLQK